MKEEIRRGSLVKCKETNRLGVVISVFYTKFDDEDEGIPPRSNWGPKVSWLGLNFPEHFNEDTAQGEDGFEVVGGFKGFIHDVVLAYKKYTTRKGESFTIKGKRVKILK